MILSKIIRGDQVNEAERWSIPSVEQPKQQVPTDYSEGISSVCAQIPTQQELEELKTKTYEQAFEKGMQEGREHALNESGSLLKVAQNLMNQLSEPIEFIDQQVREQLVALSVAIAKQIVKKELQHDAEYVLKLVDEAVMALPDSPSTIYVHLNPKDAADVKQKLEQDDKHPKWSIVEDPQIESGGCKVFTDSTSIDLSLDAQLARVAAKFLDIDEEDGGDLDQLSL